MFEKILRWLLPDFFRTQENCKLELNEISKLATGNQHTNERILRCVAAVLRQQIKQMDAMKELCGNQQHLLEQTDELNHRQAIIESVNREILDIMPVATRSNRTNFPNTVHKGGKEWPR